MRRLVTLLLVAPVAIIVTLAILLFAPQIVGGFFDALGAKQNFGTTGNAVIPFGAATTSMALGVAIAVPGSVAAALYFSGFIGGGRRRRGR